MQNILCLNFILVTVVIVKHHYGDIKWLKTGLFCLPYRHTDCALQVKTSEIWLLCCCAWTVSCDPASCPFFRPHSHWLWKHSFCVGCLVHLKTQIKCILNKFLYFLFSCDALNWLNIISSLFYSNHNVVRVHTFVFNRLIWNVLD